MSDREKDQPSETLTLDPLYTDGPDALDTHDTPPIASARLSELQLRWKNVAYGLTIRRAEDLFALRAHGDSIVPKAATIVSATFDLSFHDSTRPHKVIIEPPHSVKLEFPSDAPRVNHWLDKRHFRIPSNILKTTAAILLAIASAIVPTLDDNDDDDDISTDRRAFTA